MFPLEIYGTNILERCMAHGIYAVMNACGTLLVNKSKIPIPGQLFGRI
jgi:putative effector of murein hydrolase LrgA (UPF0299 family)